MLLSYCRGNFLNAALSREPNHKHYMSALYTVQMLSTAITDTGTMLDVNCYPTNTTQTLFYRSYRVSDISCGGGGQNPTPSKYNRVEEEAHSELGVIVVRLIAYVKTAEQIELVWNRVYPRHRLCSLRGSGLPKSKGTPRTLLAQYCRTWPWE